MIVVVGAGAMGAALAIHYARGGLPTVLVGTRFDDETIDVLRDGGLHPALGVPLQALVEARRYIEWDDVLSRAEILVAAVSSNGLSGVVEDIARRVPSDAIWAIATKGWDERTLNSPSEVVASVLNGTDRIVVLAGPLLAPELVAKAPSVVVCASTNGEAASRVADKLRSDEISVEIIDDVVGAETASGYKNVTAIAVGMCEGLGELLPESVLIHRFANARAAIFAEGLQDMSRLATAHGGRVETILGPAGAGDLYVTCLGGRNGNFGRLIGAGQTPEQALASIGSTVEGVANSKVAIALAGRLGVDVRVARAVDAVLKKVRSPERAIHDLLKS